MSRTQETFRVVIADDHPVYRDGVARAITERPELALVGEAADGREALKVIDEERPEVALLDVKMPELDGIEILRALRERGNQVRVLFLSAFVDDEIVHSAFEAGAGGFLHKENPRQEICDGIVTVAQGEQVVDERAQKHLLKSFGPQGIRAFSDPELAVLRLLAEGKSNREIADELFLGVETVRTHLYKGIYPKLETNTRHGAIATAMRRGFLD